MCSGVHVTAAADTERLYMSVCTPILVIHRLSTRRVICLDVRHSGQQWRRQDFVTGGSEVWVYRGSRVRSPPVPVVMSVYQRGSLLDGLAV